MSIRADNNFGSTTGEDSPSLVQTIINGIINKWNEPRQEGEGPNLSIGSSSKAQQSEVGPVGLLNLPKIPAPQQFSTSVMPDERVGLPQVGLGNFGEIAIPGSKLAETIANPTANIPQTPQMIYTNPMGKVFLSLPSGPRQLGNF